MKEGKKILKSIEEIKNEIACFAESRNILIDKIILFGSAATGKSTKESDIDLMLVSNDFNGKTYTERIKKLLGLNRKLIKLTNKPIDILYYSSKEWNESASVMIKEAKLNGQVI